MCLFYSTNNVLELKIVGKEYDISKTTYLPETLQTKLMLFLRLLIFFFFHFVIAYELFIK